MNVDNQSSDRTTMGTRRDLLFVSSARIGLAPEVLAREPHAGDVFVYRVGISGVEEHEYRR